MAPGNNTLPYVSHTQNGVNLPMQSCGLRLFLSFELNFFHFHVSHLPFPTSYISASYIEACACDEKHPCFRPALFWQITMFSNTGCVATHVIHFAVMPCCMISTRIHVPISTRIGQGLHEVLSLSSIVRLLSTKFAFLNESYGVGARDHV